jgi:hypothetical protein
MTQEKLSAEGWLPDITKHFGMPRTINILQ